jgi:hypothetical protein
MTIQERAAQDTGGGNDRCDRVARWFLMAIAAGLAWRIARFGLHFEITGDEAGILRSVIERSYAGLLKPLSHSNVSPPMFLWMTKFLDSLFRNDWAVRVVPFLAGIGAVAMFGLICRQALSGMARWVAWAVFCVAYVPVTEGTRVKSYTIDLLVATVMLWLMLRWLLDGRKARFLVALAFCAPVFVWLSFTAVFIIGAAALILAACLAQTRLAPNGALREMGGLGWRNILAGLAFMALAALSAILMYEFDIRPGLQASLTNGLADSWKRGYPPDQVWKIPLWLLTTQTGRGFAWPVGENHFGSTLTCALWLTGLWVYWRRGNRWVWALFVAPQVLSLAAAFLHKYPYLQNPRLCMFLGPGICLFVGQGVQYFIDRLDDEKGRVCYRFTAFALLMCAVGGMARDFVLRAREVKGPGIRSTLGEASRWVGPDGQFVMLNDGYASGVFTYYIQRTVKQRVWRNGQAPTPAEPGLMLALVAVSSKAGYADCNALFAQFEKRFGIPIKVKWSQVAHEVMTDSNDIMAVWVCECEPAKPAGNG